MGHLLGPKAPDGWPSLYGGEMHGMDAVDDAIDFGRALEQLTGQRALALTLWSLGHTQVEIADVFHMTYQGVQSLISTAIGQIKKRMA